MDLKMIGMVMTSDVEVGFKFTITGMSDVQYG